MAANLANAIQLWRHGHAQQAERACTALLTGSPDAPAVRSLLAEIYSARGQFRAASEQLQRAADLQPRDGATWRRLGDAQFASADYSAAEASFRKAIALDRRHPRAHNNLGRTQAAQGRHEAAAECFRRAIELDSSYAIAYNNLGMALAELGALDEALHSYERALALNPKFLEALSNQGNALLRLQRAERALDSFEQALLISPGNGTVLCNCGNALLQLRRYAAARACFDRALALIPDFVPALLGRASLFKLSRRHTDALALYQRLTVLAPDNLEARCNEAGLLLDMERFEAAVECCDRILKAHPNCVEALLIRGLAFNYRGGAHYAEGARTFARMYDLAPHTPALGLLIYASSMTFDWSRPELRGEAERLTREQLPVITPLALLAVTDDATLQLQAARSSIALYHPAAPPLWQGERWQNPRIRLAYISGDLRDHALAYLMVGVFEKHDRERFEVLGVSLREPLDNPIGRRVLNSLDLFLDVHEQSDLQAAQLLRQMQVDIAIDLMGITHSHRLGIFAHRPAPIQATYLGYPGTTGAPYIDYILADEFLIPPSSRAHYGEHVVGLPECFQANDDRRFWPDGSARRAQFGLPENVFVLCSFNSCYKITPEMFDIWCRLLHARPHAVLWLLAESAIAEQNLYRNAEQRGIDPSRLILARRSSYEDHLARLQLADLFLDSFPFNAGTTASDALWAGLPLLTCAGRAFASRMAGSLLHALGLPELIATDLAIYEQRALELIDCPELLGALRDRLARRREAACVFDTQRVCRHLESAYQLMYERQQRGEPPAPLQVPRLPFALPPAD